MNEDENTRYVVGFRDKGWIEAKSSDESLVKAHYRLAKNCATCLSKEII